MAIQGVIAPDAFWQQDRVMRSDNDSRKAKGETVTVVLDDEPAPTDGPDDGDDGITVTRLENGNAIIDFSGRGKRKSAEDSKFDDNLAEVIPSDELARIAEDLLEGIDVDLQSREDWITARTRAMELLGLKIEQPRTGPGGQGAPLTGMSTVKDPSLTEAVIRGQANAIGEFLPASGPVKIDDIGDEQNDADAELLENGFNNYLTVTATEYYPDTKRMFAWLYFGGSGVKKVYHCPLRRRPVSESIDMQNFIVSNAATDLMNAERVTHVIPDMRKSTYKRMVHAGVYLDVANTQPMGEDTDRVTEKAQSIEGVRKDNNRPEDATYKVYETRCELLIADDDLAPSDLVDAGVPLPYRVSIEKDSRRILEVRRDWDENDKEAKRKETFVKYCYIDWIGFYGIGLLHIIGNLTMALTAMLRIAIDNGMFANFPGGLAAKTPTGQQLTNEFQMGPGQFASVDMGSIDDIRKVVMSLPYKDVSTGFLAMLDKIREFTQRVGGTADMPISEGRADIPVGTVLALIEQATKVESAVHKGMYQSQAKELQLLIERLREDPEAFWRHDRLKGGRTNPWTVERFLAALDNHDLVPKADPNTPSHLHRVLKAVAMLQMAKEAPPGLFNMRKIYAKALRVLGQANPEEDFLPEQTGPAPPSAQDTEAQAKLLTAQAKQADATVKAKTSEASVKEKLLGHVSDEKIAMMNLQKEKIIHAHDAEKDKADHGLAAQDQQHRHQMDRAGHALDAGKAAHDAAMDVHGAGIDTRSQAVEEHTALNPPEPEAKKP